MYLPYTSQYFLGKYWTVKGSVTNIFFFYKSTVLAKITIRVSWYIYILFVNKRNYLNIFFAIIIIYG